MAMQLLRTVVGRIPKFDDVEIHVSEVVSHDRRFAEFREYIPSLDAYGKGLTFPIEMLNEVLNAAEKMPYPTEGGATGG
jgi:hypothetical protein